MKIKIISQYSSSILILPLHLLYDNDMEVINEAANNIFLSLFSIESINMNTYFKDFKSIQDVVTSLKPGIEKYIVFEKMREFETMKKNRSTVTTEDNHLQSNKNYDMVDLYKKLKVALFKDFMDAGTGATSYYVHWNVSGANRTRQFVNFYIQKGKIRILTLTPIRNYGLGESVPDTHLWVLNYQTDIYTEGDIEKVKGIILDSYNQIKQLI